MPIRHTLLLAAATLALAACYGERKHDEAAPGADAAAAVDHKDPVASALAAAPAAVGKNAAVATMDAAGKMTMVRQGTNGWTCMPDNPATPGPDPMCMDANAMDWTMAWIGHKPPPTDRPGVMYMLAGGTDASNSDPYATKPTEGGDWIKTGAHLMLVGSSAALKGYPTGATPDTTEPYVMWAGTPYAHLMIPTG